MKKLLAMPELKEFVEGELLDVSMFKDFLSESTSAEHPVFIRKPLFEVHDSAVEAINANIRLISLVGCPGTGKTWCGWLVLHSLQRQNVNTLHVSFRGTGVTAVIGLTTKERYAGVESGWAALLSRLINAANCKVCVVDVGDLQPDVVGLIFRHVRTLITTSQIIFMCVMSGHGEELITGKGVPEYTPLTLVLWSWTRDEIAAYTAKLQQRDLMQPPEDAFFVCGGSVRYLFDVDKARTATMKLVKRLSQEELQSFVKLDLPSSDQNHKQISGLMAFSPRQGERHTDGVAGAIISPRSAFVIRCLKESEHSSFERTAEMYQRLLRLNVGGAGIAFEELVHIFWRDSIKATLADNGKVTLRLLDSNTKTLVEEVEIEVNDKSLPYKHGSFDLWEECEEKDPLYGYFEPESRLQRAVDSILRFNHNGKCRILALQVSIGRKPHTNVPLVNRLLTQHNEGEQPTLCMWDCEKAGKSCSWKEPESSSWKLLHVVCPQFDEKLRKVGIIQ